MTAGRATTSAGGDTGEPADPPAPRIPVLTASAAQVLAAVRAAAAPAVTVAEAAAATGLSRPTVEVALDRLAALGLVGELAPDPGERRMGRPARNYRFRPGAGYVLGLDIGKYKVLAVLADLDGAVLTTRRIEVDPAQPRKARLAAARTAARAALTAADLTPDRLWAVTAGTTGIVDREGRIKLSSALPEWTGLHLARSLGRTFACPVLVENDCRLAAVAERWLGVARQVDDVVYLLAGMRMGVGVLNGGVLQRGHNGSLGEIGALPEIGWNAAPGHLVDDPDAESSEQAVAALIAAARAGDANAADRIRRFLGAITLGAATVALAFDPELVVVGGGFSRADDLVREPVQHALDTLCPMPPRVASSTLGEDAVALGAVRVALDHVEAQLA
ncbi:ROK family protein [Kitasatospora griseola]|uniref:ROK family protein n=1 Tax=Kitasatospora griseola TaxID=2064 RepID=UPI0034204D7D